MSLGCGSKMPHTIAYAVNSRISGSPLPVQDCEDLLKRFPPPLPPPSFSPSLRSPFHLLFLLLLMLHLPLFLFQSFNSSIPPQSLPLSLFSLSLSSLSLALSLSLSLLHQHLFNSALSCTVWLDNFGQNEAKLADSQRITVPAIFSQSF